MAENTQPQSSGMDQEKMIAIIGYLVPILFFLPMVMGGAPSAFAKFHANQQLNLLLFWVIGSVASTVLTVILIGPLIGLAVGIAGLVFMVMGIISAANGEMKPLPLVGGFSLIK